MRKLYPIALLGGLACLLLVASGARAGVTLDAQFVDQIYPTGITIVPGDNGGGPGCTFKGYYHRVVTTGRCMDVMMRIEGAIGVIGSSFSVGFTQNHGLAVDSFREWSGVGVSWNPKGVVQKSCAPMDGVTQLPDRIGKFDCAVPFPPDPGAVMQPGTYQMGTIVWDTSATTVGTEGIYVLATLVAAVINGNAVDYTGSVVTGTYLLNIIPEPGTAGLLGLGLVGLVLAARRREPPTRIPRRPRQGVE